MKFLSKLWSDGGFRLLTLFLIIAAPVFQIGVYIVDGSYSFPWYVIGAVLFWLFVLLLSWLLRNNP